MAVSSSGKIAIWPGLMVGVTTGEGSAEGEGEGAGEGSTAAAAVTGPNVKSVKSGEGEGEAEDNPGPAARRRCRSFVAFHNAQDIPGGGANVGSVVGLSVAIVLLNDGKREGVMLRNSGYLAVYILPF